MIAVPHLRTHPPDRQPRVVGIGRQNIVSVPPSQRTSSHGVGRRPNERGWLRLVAAQHLDSGLIPIWVFVPKRISS